MYVADLLRRSGRSIRSAKVRTFLTATAIGVGTFALTLTLAASNGATQFVNGVIADNFDPSELIVTNDEAVLGRADTNKPQQYDDSFTSGTSNAGAAVQVKQLTDADLTKLEKIDGVDYVRRDISINVKYIQREQPRAKKYVATVQTFSPSQKPDLLAGSITNNLAGHHILLPEVFLEPLGFKDATSAVGQKVTVAVQAAIDPAQIQAKIAAGLDAKSIQKLSTSTTFTQTFTIAAVAKPVTVAQPGTELHLYANEKDLVGLQDVTTKNTDAYHKYLYAYVRVKDGTNEQKLNAVQNKIKQLGYQAQSVKDTQEFLNQIISVLQGIVVAFSAISVIASVFGIINTMYISVIQRTREIGLMKALGMSQRDISRLFKFEAAWIGFLGGLLGSLAALAAGYALNPWITEKLSLGDGKRLLVFQPLQIVLLIVALMVVATLAGLLPARKAAKLDPIEALRTE